MKSDDYANTSLTRPTVANLYNAESDNEILTCQVRRGSGALIYHRYRVGKFYIPLEMIEDDPEAVMKIMAQCIIHQAEHRYSDNRFEYYAFSPCFDIKPEGEPHKVYDWIITKNDHGDITHIEAQ